LILTLRVRPGLPLPDGSATLAPCFTSLFRRPFVRHAPEMREFAAFACDFALSVAVHGRESALACRHLTSVVTNGSALRMPWKRVARRVREDDRR
jgi:hypothetical protein